MSVDTIETDLASRRTLWWFQLMLLIGFCVAPGCFVDVAYPENSGDPALDRGGMTNDRTAADVQLDGLSPDEGSYGGGGFDGTVEHTADATAPSDMAVAVSDTAVVASDMAIAPSDMAVAPSDMAVAPSDMAVAPSDMAVAPSDMAVAPPDMSPIDMRLAVDMTPPLDMSVQGGFDPTGWVHNFQIRITPPDIEGEVQDVLVYLKLPVDNLRLNEFMETPRHEFRFVTTEGQEVPFDIVTCNPSAGSNQLAVILRLPRIVPTAQAALLPDGAQHLLMYVGNPSAVGWVQRFWSAGDVMMLNGCDAQSLVSSLQDVTGNEHHGLPLSVGGSNYNLRSGQWGRTARFRGDSRAVYVPSLEPLGNDQPFSLSFTLQSFGWNELEPLFDGRPVGEEAIRIIVSESEQNCLGYISSSRTVENAIAESFRCSPNRIESYFTLFGSPSQGLTLVVDGVSVADNLPFGLIRLSEMTFGSTGGELAIDEVYLGLYETSLDWAKVRHASMANTLFTLPED